jgi:hypothetical protein
MPVQSLLSTRAGAFTSAANISPPGHTLPEKGPSEPSVESSAPGTACADAAAWDAALLLCIRLLGVRGLQLRLRAASRSAATSSGGAASLTARSARSICDTCGEVIARSCGGERPNAALRNETSGTVAVAGCPTWGNGI